MLFKEAGLFAYFQRRKRRRTNSLSSFLSSSWFFVQQQYKVAITEREVKKALRSTKKVAVK